MNNIYLQYLKLKSFMLDSSNIWQTVFLGILSVSLFTVNELVANRAVEIVSGILASFVFSIFLIKLPAIINYFKGQPV